MKPETLDLLQASIGAYLGETMRRAFGATWFCDGDYDGWRLDFTFVYLTFNPIGMAREALTLGDRRRMARAPRGRRWRARDPRAAPRVARRRSTKTSTTRRRRASTSSRSPWTRSAPRCRTTETATSRSAPTTTAGSESRRRYGASAVVRGLGSRHRDGDRRVVRVSEEGPPREAVATAKERRQRRSSRPVRARRQERRRATRNGSRRSRSRGRAPPAAEDGGVGERRRDVRGGGGPERRQLSGLDEHLRRQLGERGLGEGRVRGRSRHGRSCDVGSTVDAHRVEREPPLVAHRHSAWSGTSSTPQAAVDSGAFARSRKARQRSTPPSPASGTRASSKVDRRRAVRDLDSMRAISEPPRPLAPIDDAREHQRLHVHPAFAEQRAQRARRGHAVLVACPGGAESARSDRSAREARCPRGERSRCSRARCARARG